MCISFPFLCNNDHKCNDLKQCPFIGSVLLEVQKSGMVYLYSLLRVSQDWNQDIAWLSSPLQAQRRYYFQVHFSCSLKLQGWGLHSLLAISRQLLSAPRDHPYILCQVASSAFKTAMVCESFLCFEFLTSSFVTRPRKLLAFKGFYWLE